MYAQTASKLHGLVDKFQNTGRFTNCSSSDGYSCDQVHYRIDWRVVCRGTKRSMFRQCSDALQRTFDDSVAAEREAAQRAAETPEQSQARRQPNAQYLASQRADKKPEQYQDWRSQQATYMASQRDTETAEAAKCRRCAVIAGAQQRRLIFTRNSWRRGVFDKAAFEYDETLITKATSL
ncbi:hypothetical protein TNCV_4210831 [Trichonephila clavipes]|nr:hypothetical protein TNCV_4210831 [Trichonephila clavipes]